MGIANWLGIGKEIAEPVEAVGKLFNNLFTSDDERLTGAQVMERLRQKPGELLNAIDKIYANSTDIFAKRARPFCVYVAGMNAAQVCIAVTWFGKSDNMPGWFITMTTTGFLGALGIYGAIRTVEKLTGKTK